MSFDLIINSSVFGAVADGFPSAVFGRLFE
jgi:hypothetical protein